MSLSTCLAQALPEAALRAFRKTRKLCTGCEGTLREWVCPSVSAIRGPEKNGGEALSFLYCGDDEQYRNYIGRIAFGPSAAMEDLGRMPVWKVKRLIHGNEGSFHGAWVEWNPVTRCVFNSPHSITLPRWVEAWLDIPDKPDEFRKKRGFRDVVRHIKKQGYAYEVTREREKLDFFYHRMYGPTIRETHSECAYLISYPFFERLCEHSDLLLVTEKGEYVAGVLIQYENSDAVLAYMGLEGGDRRHVRDGASGALYYFAMDWLRSRGYSTCSMGGSKSFLNDGVLTTKIRKDGYLRMPKFLSEENVMLLFLRDAPAFRDFLFHNPFVTYRDGHAIEAVLFADLSRADDGVAAEAVVSPYLGYRGIDEWRIYTFENGATGMHCVTGPKTGARITLAPFTTGGNPDGPSCRASRGAKGS